MPSWGPTTEVWTEKSKLDYEKLQDQFRTADIDGCGFLAFMPTKRACLRACMHPQRSLGSVRGLGGMMCINLCLHRNGVIDREELRALLESTDSGAQYSITVSSSSHAPFLWRVKQTSTPVRIM